MIDHFTATCDGVKLSCLQFLFAGTSSTILALFFDTISLQVLLDCIWPLLYVGVFSCGVGYTLQILAQKGSNPTVVTILLSLESVFAVIAGAVVLHQQMTGREYLGCVLMFAAVVLPASHAPEKGSQSRITRTHNKTDAAAAASVFILRCFPYTGIPPTVPFLHKNVVPSHY